MIYPTIDKIKDFYKNPIKIFGLIVIILSLVLLFGCHFHFPDFYTNRELADNLAQTVIPSEVSYTVKHLLNPKYNFYNTIFQIWGYCITVFVVSLIFKIKEFKSFKEINLLNNKLFIYLWINLSYLIWSFFYVMGYMIDLEKYVYNWAADSMGIPFFTMIGMLTFIGIIYYPIINILSFITFNTKIRRIFYNFLWGLGFLFLLRIALDSCIWKFTYIHLFLDLFYFICLHNIELFFFFFLIS